jgi:histone H3
LKNRDGYRFTPDSLRAIQEAVETSITSLYEDANLCSHHAKRVTVMESDVRLAQRIRGTSF